MIYLFFFNSIINIRCCYMKNFIIYILLMCIYHSVLLFGKHLGINVLLFVLPLLLLILFVLEKNKKINNRHGLLFFVPIATLSAGYLLYDRTIFNYFNILVIPLLFVLMFVFTTNEKVHLVIPEAFKVIFLPIGNIPKVYRLLNNKFKKVIRFEKNTWIKILSIIIVVPIVLIVIQILASADLVFNNMFKNVFEVLSKIRFDNILGRLITIVVLFTYLSAVLNYVLFNFKAKNYNFTKPEFGTFIFKLLLTSLNVIYLIFDIIQIRSLMLHRISMDIPYAEYARQGFFQLMFISIFNLIVILLSKNTKENTYNKIMSILMVLFTFVIILSSTYRMFMYEMAYGYTLLRLLVYATLFTEIILLIPTILYIFKRINILRYYFIICLIVYCCLSVAPLDSIIATRNINRYYETDDIDLDYLMNDRANNIPQLVHLYYRGDSWIRNDLDQYFIDIHDRIKEESFQEFNLSRNYSNFLLEKSIIESDESVNKS